MSSFGRKENGEKENKLTSPDTGACQLCDWEQVAEPVWTASGKFSRGNVRYLIQLLQIALLLLSLWAGALPLWGLPSKQARPFLSYPNLEEAVFLTASSKPNKTQDPDLWHLPVSVV